MSAMSKTLLRLRPTQSTGEYSTEYKSLTLNNDTA